MVIGHPPHQGGDLSLRALLRSEASECGIASLAMLANFHGLRRDVVDLRRASPRLRVGTCLTASGWVPRFQRVSIRRHSQHGHGMAVTKASTGAPATERGTRRRRGHPAVPRPTGHRSRMASASGGLPSKSTPARRRRPSNPRSCAGAFGPGTPTAPARSSRNRR